MKGSAFTREAEIRLALSSPRLPGWRRQAFVPRDAGNLLEEEEVATSSAAPASGRGQEDRAAGTGARSARRDTETGSFGERTRAAQLASAADSLASIVRSVAWVVAAIIAVGILLVVLKANANNGIVSTVRAIAHDLVGPFTGMFQLDPRRAGVAANWAIAAAAYVLAGLLVARLIATIGTLGRRRRGAPPPDRRSETTSGPSTQASR